MPIVVSVRQDFSSPVFRDAVIRALSQPEITTAYIASGYFSDITKILDSHSPDFGISGEMEGKEVFLFGGHDLKKTAKKLKALHNELTSRGVKAHTFLTRLSEHPKDTQLRWHAKLAVFLSGTEPVLAIAGSSNFTSPTMYGPSEKRFLKAIPYVQVEADTYFWKKGNLGAAHAMHEALHYWEKKRIDIPFDDAAFDNEIAKLIEHTFQSITSSPWDRLT